MNAKREQAKHYFFDITKGANMNKRYTLGMIFVCILVLSIQVAQAQDAPNRQIFLSIDEAIDSLPEKYREVIVYRHRDDQS